MLIDLESGPWVWKSNDLAGDQGWIRRLADAPCCNCNREECELCHSDKNEQRRLVDSPVSDLRRTLSVIGELRQQLERGRGLYLLRGIDLQGIALEQFSAFGAWLAEQLGRKLISQNLAGDVLAVIRNDDGNGEHNVRRHGHRSRAEMLHHSDSCEIVVLICVKSARLGGAMSVCSAAAVHNSIKEIDPAFVATLERRFFFDMTGKTANGFSSQRLPVFFRDDFGLRCRFNRQRIESGMSRAGVHLTGDEVAALDCMSSIVQNPEFSFRFALQPGDIVFLKNARVLHARDHYEDWQHQDEKRFLVRLWLD